mmetsp:Transcript_9324/g.19380  ORF Transcript_9324/g.19380 Transcript_9324/m.19380 type:complete len:132 (-) Transcript_9324:13-408(-)
MHSLARDIMNEFAMDKDSADAPSNRTAAPSDFLYRKARLIAMSCRHAFPPSKCPTGKLDNIAFCLSAAVLWPPLDLGTDISAVKGCSNGESGKINGGGVASSLSQNDLFVWVVLGAVATPMWREERVLGWS